MSITPTPRRSARSVVARLLVASALTAVPAVALSSGAASAQTAGPAIAVSKTTGLDPAGDRVTVSGTGYAPGQGLYIQFCPQPGGALGTAGGRATGCNPDQGNDHTIWKTPVAGDGTWSVELAIQSSWGSTNCTTTTCGVFTRRDHMGGATDFSQDAFLAVQFAAAAEPAPTPTPAPTTSAVPQLAETGLSADLAAAAGAALLIGLALVGSTRRRRED
ncbi:MAG: neocarzinostatin apoprotein domain-containing protein [Acidimicrobiia bacterium]